MSRNWLHLTGLDGAGKEDLTVTSTGSAKVGDVVTAGGTVVVNKDFGFGYKYDVMLENAVIAAE